MGVIAREKVKGSGKWWVIINRYGRRVSKYIGKSQDAAEAFAEEVERRMAFGFDPFEDPDEEDDRERIPTLKEYFKQTFQPSVNGSIRESTFEIYELCFSRFEPYLGHLRLDQIRRSDVQKLIAALLVKDFTKTTIRLTVATLARVLSHAVEDEIIQKNPARRMGRFFREARVLHDRIEPLTGDEVVKFLGKALEISADYYALFLCAIHTGLRAGEIAGLQWGDIDFSGQYLMVRRAYSHDRLTQTKTGKVRRVDLSTTLVQTLSELKRKRKEEWLKKGSNEIPPWVFANREGNPPDMQNVTNRHFKKCLEKAELREIRFHDLRYVLSR